jgi:hypothetical protein
MWNSRSCRGLRALLLSCLFVPAFGVADDHPCDGKCGEVLGNVAQMVRSSLLPVPGAKLVFIDGQWARYETRTDASGRYKIDLPYGTYWMRVLKDGACGTQRPDFGVSAGESLHFDFELVSCDAIDGPPAIAETLPSGVDAKPIFTAATGYSEEVIPKDTRLGRPEIRVAFGKNIPEGALEDYKSFVPRNSKVPFRVTLMADRYTIRAQTIRFNRKEMIFMAEGDVEVSDGSKTEQAKTATMSFPTGILKLEIGR